MNTPKTANVFTINGKQYDAETGLLIDSPAQKQVAQSLNRLRQPARPAVNVHGNLQRSQTLRRRSVAKPNLASAVATTPKPVSRPSAGRATVQRSPMIRRFSDVTPVRKSVAQTVPVTRIAPQDRPFKSHPLAQKAAVRSSLESAKAPAQAPLHSQPASVIKQAVIKEAMERTADSSQNQRTSRTRRKKSSPKSFRFASLASASLAVIMLGGYFSYLAMPNLSVRVAAIQSGVDASYPGYRPGGYSLDGPVAYSGGQVSMTFSANGGPQQFTLTQSNSSWDSTAVETNYVQPDVGDDYSVTKKQGLTIYTYDSGKAAWVNKGVFYSLKGDAPLSSDQVARIATSM